MCFIIFLPSISSTSSTTSGRTNVDVDLLFISMVLHSFGMITVSESESI